VVLDGVERPPRAAGREGVVIAAAITAVRHVGLELSVDVEVGGEAGRLAAEPLVAADVSELDLHVRTMAPECWRTTDLLLKIELIRL